MHVTIRNVHFFTLIPSPKSEIVRGMTEVFVGMVQAVDIGTFEENFV